jgi:hypothetical protein
MKTPIINKVYSQEDLYDAFEGIQERLYLTMNDVDFRYYRITITEIDEQEYNESL